MIETLHKMSTNVSLGPIERETLQLASAIWGVGERLQFEFQSHKMCSRLHDLRNNPALSDEEVETVGAVIHVVEQAEKFAGGIDIYQQIIDEKAKEIKA